MFERAHSQTPAGLNVEQKSPFPHPARGFPGGVPLLHLQRAAGNTAVSKWVTGAPDVSLARQPLDAAAAAAPAVAQPTYVVGGVTYRESDFGVAVGQIADLWTSGIGVVSQRKGAVAEFCGSGGAGANAEDSTLTESLLGMALTGLLAVATDGVGLVVAGALSRAVVGIAKRVSVDPGIVLGLGDHVIKAVVAKGKAEAQKAIPAAVMGARARGPSAGIQLATPLATYQSALNASLDADAEGSKVATLNSLLALKGDPVGWATAAALYDAVRDSVAIAKGLQWNATSDGWFSMQTSGGAGTLSGVDSGIVSVMFTKDAYPTSPLRVDGAFLGGPGAVHATVSKYDDRPIGEINVLKRLIMDNGSMGRGWVECAWEVDVDEGGTVLAVRAHNRYGYPWLASKKLGLRDLATDSPKLTHENCLAGAQMVWDEIKTKSVAQFGAAFAVTRVTSGTGSY
jgi:hypothetical protein